ncbi:alpha/beta hydrolase [soil metagenome]
MFGPEGPLVGILTEANPEYASADLPSVVFLNSGIVHRVGANRMYVRIARRLAERGFTTLRFDHAGIGDSGPRRDDRPFNESAVEEARAAMELLARVRGSSRFILGGLCSGADVAFWTALGDDRVVGLFQMDPFVYRTPRFLLSYYLPRLLSPAAWWRSLSSRGRHLAGRLRSGAGGPPQDTGWAAPEYTRIFPPRSEVAGGLRTLADRGVSFYVFVSGTMFEYVSYADQYERSFPEVDFGGRLVVDFAPEADHTVTDPGHQERVIQGIEGWATERWPSSNDAPGGSGS